MSVFTVESPAAIHFGVDTLDRLGQIVAKDGPRVLVLTGERWMASSGWTQKLRQLLSGHEVQSLPCPHGEPSTESLASCAEAAHPFSPTVIVAIGGGSVLDTAKALSALLRHGGPVSRYLEGVPGSATVPGPGLPGSRCRQPPVREPR